MFGTHEAKLPAPSMVVRDAYDPVTNNQRPRFPGEFKGDPLTSEKALSLGALAFGVDLEGALGWPVRLELEASTRVDGQTKGDRIRYHAENPNDHNIIGGYSHGHIDIYNESLNYNINTVFANLYIDWHNKSRFTPYVGGGLGVAFLFGKVVFYSEASNIRYDKVDPAGPDPPGLHNAGPRRVEMIKKVRQLAWHLEAGTAFDLTEDFSLVAGYRYLNLGKDIPFEEAINQTYSYMPIKPELYTNWPRKIEFEPVHQVVIGFRYHL